MIRWLLAASLLLCASIALARPASAHAILEWSSPADGSVLKSAPSEVRLRFNEDVTITLGSLRVVDARGHRIDLGNVQHGASNREVVVGLRNGLAVGTYVVGWHVISADTHPVHGGFVFSLKAKTTVANGVVSSLASPADAASWRNAGRVLRWLGYGGSMLAVGMAVFSVWVDDRRHDERRTVPRPRLPRLVALAGVVATSALVIALATDAAEATGLGIGAVFRGGVLRQVLGGGVSWTIAGVAVASLLAWLGAVTSRRAVLRLSRRAARTVSLLAVVVLAGAFAASGHTRTTSPAAVVVVADSVHVAAGALWFGGLVGLVLALRHIRRVDDSTATDPAAAEPTHDAPVQAARLVGRFSRMASWSLLAVAAGGLTLAWAEIRAARAITSTTYGWLVVAKVSVVAAIALVGAYNHFRLTPAVAAQPTRSDRWRRLNRTIRVEAVALVAVLALTAVLADTIPARTQAGIGTVVARTAPFGDGSVQIVVDPAQRGDNAVHFYVLDRYGTPFDKLTHVRVDFTLPAAQLGPIERTPLHAGPGHWQLTDDTLSISGTWRVTVRAQPSEFSEIEATVSVPVQP